jgi:glycosyltransferase involved in cell wall biosynthesis
MTLVSVIVPTRNSSRTIEACLQSIKSQTHRETELVVIDNSSNDGTADIARRYADVLQTRGPERSAQRNYGAKLARGEFLMFVDSDMTLEPGVVAECLSASRSFGVCPVIVPELTVGDGFWCRCRALERSCYVGDDSIEAARFFSRTIFESIGGYDEGLTGPEDWDLSVRASAGRTLPRTRSRILHDETRVRLAELLAKKRYYASSFRLYWKKHGTPALRQTNTLMRPAFIKHWRRLVREPVLATGLLSLKVLELGAALTGVLGNPGLARRQLGPPHA